jgi:methylated-DNA-[protein]-cysteine S-methyltransferase
MKTMLQKRESHFRETVFAVVRHIPKGKVLTYKEVASRAGSPRAYRAVGNILNTNYDPKIPCHRVVRADGALGGYNRGAQAKIIRLRKEGAIL